MSRYRAQVREVINRNTVVSLALDQGYNAFIPVFDGGIDFILYREADGALLKVQLKSRWTIDRKYVGRDIWIAFPIAADWYLIPHDVMLEIAEAQGVTATESWKLKGTYSKPRPSKALMDACAPYRFAEIEEVAEEASEDDAPSSL